MKTKRKKMPEATVYAIRNADGFWLAMYADPGAFTNAAFFGTRADAVRLKHVGETIVPCRVRVLPSAKKAPKRTR